jgi:hypothetical protein
MWSTLDSQLYDIPLIEWLYRREFSQDSTFVSATLLSIYDSLFELFPPCITIPQLKLPTHAISTVKKTFKELLPFEGGPAVVIAKLNVGSNRIHERINDKQEGDHVGTHDPLPARKFPRHQIIRLCCTMRHGQRCTGCRKTRSGGCGRGNSSGRGCDGEARSCIHGQAE